MSPGYCPSQIFDYSNSIGQNEGLSRLMTEACSAHSPGERLGFDRREWAIYKNTTKSDI
jgi:hypothetical protein